MRRSMLRLVLLTAIAVLGACGPSPDARLQEAMAAAPDSISFPALVEGDWTKMCVVMPYTRPADARDRTGLRWRGFSRSGIEHRDDVVLLVFARNDRVTTSALVDRRADFQRDATFCFAREDAVFSKTASPSGAPWYLLTPREDDGSP